MRLPSASNQLSRSAIFALLTLKIVQFREDFHAAILVSCTADVEDRAVSRGFSCSNFGKLLDISIAGGE
jgi:hypothetical protein